MTKIVAKEDCNDHLVNKPSGSHHYPLEPVSICHPSLAALCRWKCLATSAWQDEGQLLINAKGKLRFPAHSQIKKET